MVAPRTASTQPYAGFLLAFEPRRTEDVRKELEVYQRAVESFSAKDWTFEQREIVLLVLDRGEPSIGAAALMRRVEGSGGTGKLKMGLVDPVLIPAEIYARELGGLDLAAHVSTAERMQRIPPTVWEALIAAIRRLRPGQAAALDRLIASRTEDHRLLGDSPRVQRLVEQRDAVGVTLDIARAERQRQEVLGSVNTGRIDDAASVLDLIDAMRFGETPALHHDKRVFEGLLDDTMRGAQFHVGGGNRVRIFVHDNTPLEAVLGTDLLIFQAKYRSYLLIQYKSMDRVQGRSGETWSYAVDARMKGQMRRMRRGQAAMQSLDVREEGIAAWRLHGSPFYFKFCESTRPRARDDSLVQGIILGVDHLDRFVTQREAENEGRRAQVGYDNCPRYLNNTQFVDLARSGWIGCDQRGFTLISRILRARGKRAMLAVIEGELGTGAQGRSWKSR